MIDRATRWWDSLTARVRRSSDDKTDPKIQLEQAIVEAQHQHKRLKDQAASVIANQKQAEIRLNTKMGELEKLNRNTRQALLMASDADKSGDGATAEQYDHAAETIADKLIAVEADVESLKTMVLESTQATDQAKAAVKTNSRLLQEKLAERSKQLSQLEQAKMQEEMNAAMAQLSETVGDDVPTFAEVEAKIEARYARAMAAAEQQETSSETRIEEIEEATTTAAAKERLADLRAELGLT
jgi:phage shock protein A